MTTAWTFKQSDRIAFFDSLEEKSLDLVFGSPPYESARTYGIDFNLCGQDWVDWMVETYRAASRACKGLVAFVLEGQTRNYQWSATPALLMADLHRAGFNLRRPIIYHRIGIPGSGGHDWLRADTEYIVCVTPPGRLPWSDNTACGHKPKWGPGGEMSYRQSDGTRRNQWGSNSCNERKKDGSRNDNASVKKLPKVTIGRRVARGTTNGDTQHEDAYLPPVKANPGNACEAMYCAKDLAEIISVYESGDFASHKVGGGLMGHKLAHENEAPFPLKLADFFVRSFSPPGGLVSDCFLGSGTTAQAAIEAGRNFIGCDIRESQVLLATKRLEEIAASRQ